MIRTLLARARRHTPWARAARAAVEKRDAQFRFALHGYHDSDLIGLAVACRKASEVLDEVDALLPAPKPGETLTARVVRLAAESAEAAANVDAPDGFEIWKLNGHDRLSIRFLLGHAARGPFIKVKDTWTNQGNRPEEDGRVFCLHKTYYVSARALRSAREDEYLVAKPVAAAAVPVDQPAVLLKQCRTCRHDDPTHMECSATRDSQAFLTAYTFTGGLPPEDADGCGGWAAKVG